MRRRRTNADLEQIKQADHGSLSRTKTQPGADDQGNARPGPVMKRQEAKKSEPCVVRGVFQHAGDIGQERGPDFQMEAILRLPPDHAIGLIQ